MPSRHNCIIRKRYFVIRVVYCTRPWAWPNINAIRYHPRMSYVSPHKIQCNSTVALVEVVVVVVMMVMVARILPWPTDWADALMKCSSTRNVNETNNDADSCHQRMMTTTTTSMIKMMKDWFTPPPQPIIGPTTIRSSPRKKSKLRNERGIM